MLSEGLLPGLERCGLRCDPSAPRATVASVWAIERKALLPESWALNGGTGSARVHPRRRVRPLLGQLANAPPPLRHRRSPVVKVVRRSRT